MRAFGCMHSVPHGWRLVETLRRAVEELLPEGGRGCRTCRLPKAMSASRGTRAGSSCSSDTTPLKRPCGCSARMATPAAPALSSYPSLACRNPASALTLPGSCACTASGQGHVTASGSTVSSAFKGVPQVRWHLGAAPPCSTQGQGQLP